jgi:hypothetical protein
MQPIKREARRDEYECVKYPQVLLINKRKFPSKNIGRRPHMTAMELVKKQEIPITKIPEPSPPLRALYDMLNSLLIKANPGES